jgi:hypothetical protein
VVLLAAAAVGAAAAAGGEQKWAWRGASCWLDAAVLPLCVV